MDTGADEPATSEADSSLTVSSWGNNSTIVDGLDWEGGQAATLNGITYEVTTGTAEGPFFDEDHTSLYWRQMTSNTGWSQYATQISGQAANSRVNLAAFNGYLYMVHTGDSDSAATWISKFNPATQTWSANYRVDALSINNGSPPAIVAYNNLLYLIGTQASGQMWYATMTTSEVFSPPVAIAGHTSSNRASLAVLNGKLYFGHRYGSANIIVYGTFDGATWSGVQHIPNGSATDIVACSRRRIPTRG